MTHDEMIAVIEHHKKGGTVQVRYRALQIGEEHPWTDGEREHIKWDFSNFEYRVKPEPLVFYARIADGGRLGCIEEDRKLVEINYRTFGGRIVKLVEVPEE